MTKYLIRQGEHSAELIEADKLEAVKPYDDPEDSLRVVKKFEAVCWCAANQVFAEQQGHKPYDMYFCKTGERSCPHYQEQLTRLKELEATQ